MEFWLARHAQPTIAAGVCYGASDIEADPVHTYLCADALAEVLPSGIAVWTSPLQRCRVLAQALIERRGDLRLRMDPRLREMDFGCWEGIAWDHIPPAAFDAWTQDFLHGRFGGADSVAQLLLRVSAAWHDTVAQGRDALWVTHAGVIRALGIVVAGKEAPRQAADWPHEVLGMGEWTAWSPVGPAILAP